jgi:oxygen-independent coproporphyrinogen III oxidase
VPIGLYVHIPFCLHKCGYCDFNSHAGSDRAEQAHYVDTLLREMELWATRPEVAGEQVSTVYVGGGTPTLLEGAELARVLRGVREHFRLAPDAEVTVEGNPGTVDVEGEKLHLAVQAGATRLSLGVQARQRHLLERLGRIHDARQVEAAVKAARRRPRLTSARPSPGPSGWGRPTSAPTA